MKNFKKIASAIAALSLAACVAVPMSATVFTASAEVEIQVNPNANSQDNGTHKYEAYKIFSGTMETVSGGSEKVLVGLDWAFKENADSDKKSAFLEAIKTTLSEGTFSATPTASEVAEAIKGDDDNAKAIAFSNLLSQYLELFEKTETGDDGKLKVDDAGYYLVQDAKAPELGNNNSGAKTRYILEVVDPNESPLTIEAKSAAPTVDKKVQDEITDAESGATDGWGETADHAIGEKFQFKLNAQLPNEAEIEKYKSYKLVFTDTLSAGVDINTNPNMKIYLNNGSTAVDVTTTETENVFYKIEDKKITITIKDVKALSNFSTDGSSKLQNLLVSVVYDAHLNENAIVSDSNVEDSTTYNAGSNANINNNKVSLQYSNNPNQTGGGEPELGQTPEDTVGVFTYKVTNSKVDSVETTKKLAGATFELYATDPTSGSPDPIKLVKMTGEDKKGCYRLATEAEAGSTAEPKPYVTSIDTVADEDFIFYGLDAGTYYLKETKAPDGYNSLGEAVTIEIKATHAENSTGTGAGLTLDSNDNKSTYNGTDVTTLKGSIENAKGATLPSTGGIGTTLFYLGGGALVAVAGVMLITKKRMTKE